MAPNFPPTDGAQLNPEGVDGSADAPAPAANLGLPADDPQYDAMMKLLGDIVAFATAGHAQQLGAKYAPAPAAPADASIPGVEPDGDESASADPLAGLTPEEIAKLGG